MELSLTGPEGIEKEEELANGSADVEGVEGLLQPVQLRQGGDQLQDVVFQILVTTKVFYTVDKYLSST